MNFFPEGGVKEREELQLKVAHMKEEQASEIREIRQKHQQEIDSLKKAFVEQTKTEVEKGTLNLLQKSAVLITFENDFAQVISVMNF